jgi:hypothetical protein
MSACDSCHKPVRGADYSRNRFVIRALRSPSDTISRTGVRWINPHVGRAVLRVAIRTKE